MFVPYRKTPPARTGEMSQTGDVSADARYGQTFR